MFVNLLHCLHVQKMKDRAHFVVTAILATVLIELSKFIRFFFHFFSKSVAQKHLSKLESFSIAFVRQCNGKKRAVFVVLVLQLKLSTADQPAYEVTHSSCMTQPTRSETRVCKNPETGLFTS